MPRPKKNPANTVTELVKAAQNAALGDIPPPQGVFLREQDRIHWVQVTQARARNEWTDVDLVIAANLARCLADIERISASVAVESDILYSNRGTPVANPKYALLEMLSRRVMALQRALQMQSATTGAARDKIPARKAEAAAREAAAQVSAEDDLIPQG